MNDFIASNFSRDIALLQTDKPFALNSETVAPICLPQHLRMYNFGKFNN